MFAALLGEYLGSRVKGCRSPGEDLGPHLGEELHEGIVDHEGYPDIQHYAAHTWQSSLIEGPWSLILHDLPERNT